MPLSKIDSDSLSAPLTVPAGTVSLPAITTTGDTNTGIFFPAADTVGVATGGSERVRVDSSGNVGIGTSSPNIGGANTDNAILTLKGKASTRSGIFEMGNFGTTGNDQTLGWNRYFDGSTENANIEVARASSTSTAYMKFSTNGGSGVTERARITSAGNFTVGTDDLGYKLGAVSTSTGTPGLFLRSNAASDAGTAQLRISKLTNTNTTSQIFAQFVIDGNGTNSGQINANGASAAAFGSFSDVRLKENIVNLPSQLANITALRPVEFDYKDGCGHQIGFIAQEMEQVYPDAIGVGENDMLTITGWSKTEARLVKAIQEQQALITALTTRITALEAA